MAKQRYVIDKPASEFYHMVADWVHRMNTAVKDVHNGGMVPKFFNGDPEGVGSSFQLNKNGNFLFRMDCKAAVNGGFVVDVEDITGILDKVHKPGMAYVEMEPENRAADGCRIAGPYPAMDGSVVLDTIVSRVVSKDNLDKLGMDEPELLKIEGLVIPPFDFDVKEIEEELSRRGSEALGNWTIEDWAQACTDVFSSIGYDNFMWAENNGTSDRYYKMLEPLSICDDIERVVKEREDGLRNCCNENGFMDEEFLKMCSDQFLMCTKFISDGTGITVKDSFGNGCLLGSTLGYDVYLKNRSNQLGNLYISFVDKSNDKTVSYLNARRHRDLMKANPDLVLPRVYRKFSRKCRIEDSYRRFVDAATNITNGKKI